MALLKSIFESNLFYLFLGAVIVLISNVILFKIKSKRENKLKRLEICSVITQKIWLFLRLNEQMVNHYLEWNYHSRLFELENKDFDKERINILFKYFEEYRIETYKLRGEIFSSVHDLTVYLGERDEEINTIMNSINQHCALEFDQSIKDKYKTASLEEVYDVHQKVGNQTLDSVIGIYNTHYGSLNGYVTKVKDKIKI